MADSCPQLYFITYVYHWGLYQSCCSHVCCTVIQLLQRTREVPLYTLSYIFLDKENIWISEFALQCLLSLPSFCDISTIWHLKMVQINIFHCTNAALMETCCQRVSSGHGLFKDPAGKLTSATKWVMKLNYSCISCPIQLIMKVLISNKRVVLSILSISAPRQALVMRWKYVKHGKGEFDEECPCCQDSCKVYVLPTCGQEIHLYGSLGTVRITQGHSGV